MNFTKHNENPELLRQLAIEVISNILSRALIIYTDGSKSESGRTDSDVFMEINNQTFKCCFRNPDFSFVFRFELIAINEALKLALESGISEVWILTDSKSSIQYLKDWPHILNKLGQDISVSCIIPGRLGVWL